AVANVDGLGDHVRVGALGHGRIDQAGVVLAIDVLLNGPARAAKANGVVGHAVALDEAFLGHQRGFAADFEIVVLAGAGARRVGDGVAQTEHHGFHGAARRPPALSMTDADAALKMIEQAAVPAAGVAVGTTAANASRVGQHRVAGYEAIDGAALDAH